LIGNAREKMTNNETAETAMVEARGVEKEIRHRLLELEGRRA
jgi:hypothetical protein